MTGPDNQSHWEYWHTPWMSDSEKPNPQWSVLIALTLATGVLSQDAFLTHSRVSYFLLSLFRSCYVGFHWVSLVIQDPSCGQWLCCIPPNFKIYVLLLLLLCKRFKYHFPKVTSVFSWCMQLWAKTALMCLWLQPNYSCSSFGEQKLTDIDV